MKYQIRDKLKNISFVYNGYQNLKRFKDIIKKNVIIFKSYVKHRYFSNDFPEFKGEKIKVAFLVQYIPAWNKFESLYNNLLNDDRFEVKIICLPIEIQNNVLTIDTFKNSIYDYYLSQGYDVINGLNQDGSWLDLKSFGFDYVVYTRPYNEYLPKEYSSEIVSGYSRIVNMLYGMVITKEIYDVVVNYDFFKDVYIFFADLQTTQKDYSKQYKHSIRHNLKKCYYLGKPGADQLLKDKDLSTDIWDFAGDKFKVLWTPRWTTKPELGGSNFFIYYKKILEFARENSDVAILIRPHPLMFDNFLKTGEMTKEQQLEYRSEIDKLDNVMIDETNEYDATMWKSDVMISDISAMMPEYFITGKPLIYSSSNMYCNLVEDIERMMQGCYDAPDCDKAFDYIKMLKQGNDQKADIRKKIAVDLFKIDEEKISEKMTDCLYDCIVNNK